MNASFSFALGQSIVKDGVVVGYYDAQHPTLTAGTSVGKVLLHCPHTREDQPETRLLTINKKIQALCAGPLHRKGYDVLMIGTPQTLVAYDVENNQDLFYKDIHDGVNVVAFGPVVNVSAPVCVLGGNCSIQAFDAEGTEVFWTVTGDNVSALAFVDVDDDQKPELLVGTEDYEIRVLRHEQVVKEIAETDIVTHLHPINRGKWAYALWNGTVGIYDHLKREWRTKSRNKVCSVTAYDSNGDGVDELVTGWDNGKLEVRHDTKGAVVFKEYLDAPVAALCCADYRLDGKTTLMSVTFEGGVKGWLPTTLASEAGAEAVPEQQQNASENQAFRELLAEKQKLTAALKNYDDQLSGTKAKQAGVIPTDTVLHAGLRCNVQNGNVELSLTTSNFSVIRAVVIFAEHLFDGESCVLHPVPPSSSVIVQIAPAKDVESKMLVKAMVGTSANSSVYHVFEQEYTMPKFAMYNFTGPVANDPGRGGPPGGVDTSDIDGNCEIFVSERPHRIWAWMTKAFLGLEGDPPTSQGCSVSAAFLCLRNKRPLTIQLQDGQPTSKLIIQSDEMEVVGEMIQHLCDHIGIQDIDSKANFPREMEDFKDVLVKVDMYNAARLKLTAEMCDVSNLVKTLIVKAEDYRLLNDMGKMKKTYTQLSQINQDLLMEYKKRSANHQELLAQLKIVNLMIQKAANLRVGSAKSRVITASRMAIKQNNVHELFQILRNGGEAAKHG